MDFEAALFLVFFEDEAVAFLSFDDAAITGAEARDIPSMNVIANIIIRFILSPIINQRYTRLQGAVILA